MLVYRLLEQLIEPGLFHFSLFIQLVLLYLVRKIKMFSAQLWQL